jgi:hypothetical protein
MGTKGPISNLWGAWAVRCADVPTLAGGANRCLHAGRSRVISNLVYDLNLRDTEKVRCWSRRRAEHKRVQHGGSVQIWQVPNPAARLLA